MKSNYIHSQNFHIFFFLFIKTHTVNTHKPTQTPQKLNYKFPTKKEKHKKFKFQNNSTLFFYFIVITIIAYYKHKQGLIQLFKFGLILL